MCQKPQCIKMRAFCWTCFPCYYTIPTSTWTPERYNLYTGEAWQSDIPKRKTGGLRDPSQRRIALYNYNSETHFKESWQSELLTPPRHVRWGAKRRIGYAYASPMPGAQEEPIFLD